MTSKIKTFVEVLWAHVCHTISFVVPKEQNLWVFVGWHKGAEREIFADNSKYFFLHVAQNQNNIKAVWLARDEKLALLLRQRGYIAYDIHSIRGAWYALRAKYTIVDAFLERIFWQYTGGSKIVQLWHGKGMKKTGHDGNYSLKTRKRFSEANMFVSFHRLIASSPYTAKLMGSTFREPLEKIFITGLPRNDVLMRDIKDADLDAHSEFQNRIDEARNAGRKRIIMYAPTFRPDGSNPLEQVDFKVWNTHLAEHNDQLIVSMHPKFATKGKLDSAAYSHIESISAGFDVYPQLKHIDLLITDYGSIYVDYLLLNRPIIFFTYDLDWYKEAMGLHEDFERLTPGPHPKSFKELLDVIEATDSRTKEREQVRQELFQNVDGNASIKIANLLLDHS